MDEFSAETATRVDGTSFSQRSGASPAPSGRCGRRHLGVLPAGSGLGGVLGRDGPEEPRLPLHGDFPAAPTATRTDVADFFRTVSLPEWREARRDESARLRATSLC